MKQTALPDAVKRKNGSSLCGRGVECFTLAWTAGLLSAFLHTERYAAAVLAVLVPAVLIFRRSLWRFALLILCGALLGIGVWLHYDTAVRRPLCAMDGETVTLSGAVTDMTVLTDERAVCSLRTKIAGHRCTVDWYTESGMPLPEIGDRVTLTAELTRITSDYRYHTASYQAGHDKYLRIYQAHVDDICKDTGFSLRRALHHYRADIAARIRSSLPPEEAGLLCAMIFGDKSGLDDTTRDLLNRCGIAHIAVVSGLHLVFFCGVLLWIFRRLSLPARLLFLLMLPAIVLFIMLADASVSVYRAAVMVLLSSSARLFGRRGDTLRSLCLAMFLCTAAAPYVIGSASFWLTVSGVFGIGILAPYMTAELRCGKTLRTFLSLCCVSVAVFPASVLLCGESSLLGPVTNLLILPLCVFALYLGFSMLLTGGLTAFLLPVAGMLCRAARTAAGLLAKLPCSHITVAEQPVRLALAMLTAFLLLMLAFRPKPRETAAALLSAAVLLSAAAVCSRIQCDSQLRIAVLGGKKQAALVITADGAAIIADLTGAPRNAQYVERYLAQNGITRADVLILSGGKAAAGYQSALSGTEIGAVMLCNADDWRENMTLCGKQPYLGTDTLQIKSGTLEISLSGDLLTVSRNGLRAAALPAQSEADPQTEAVIRYGETLHTVTFPAIPRTCQAQDLLIRITADGRGDVIELDELPDIP